MRSSRLLPALVPAIATACLAVPSGQRPRFDMVIANGRIVDATGAP